MACENSPYLMVNRFCSYAPTRKKELCKFYVDGSGYYIDIAKALK